MFARCTKFAALVAAGLMMSLAAHAGVIGGDNTYNSGGAGGTGLGVGVGIGIGQGGSAIQGQQQGQQQGQVAIGQGGQGGEGGKGGSATSQAGATSNAGANGNQSFNSNSVGAVGNHTEMTFEAANPGAQTAYAPNIYPTAPCMGSTSAGGQGSFFGFSFGTSWKDEDCSFREDVRTTAQVIGDRTTAAIMWCQKNDAYRKAVEAQGKDCVGNKVAQAALPPVAVTNDQHQRLVAAAVARGEVIDDLARSRAGLPPLK